jgi:hypothetical protein
MSVLDEARRELASRSGLACEVGDSYEQSILAPLADVADYVCRIGDHPESSHYRADKAGPLLAAAVRLQRSTLVGYAGGPLHEWRIGVIFAGFDVLERVRQAVTTAAWRMAKPSVDSGGVLYESDVRELRDAVREFSCWVQDLASTALPDRWDED